MRELERKKGAAAPALSPRPGTEALAWTVPGSTQDGARQRQLPWPGVAAGYPKEAGKLGVGFLKMVKEMMVMR